MIFSLLVCKEGFLGMIKHNRLTHEKAFLPKIRNSATSAVSGFRKELSNCYASVEALGEATRAGGPLDKKTGALVKLAVAVGALREGAVHSHTRRALEAGWTAVLQL